MRAPVHRAARPSRVGALSGARCLHSERVLLVFICGLVVCGPGLLSVAVLLGWAKGLTGGEGRGRSPLFALALGALRCCGTDSPSRNAPAVGRRLWRQRMASPPRRRGGTSLQGAAGLGRRVEACARRERA